MRAWRLGAGQAASAKALVPLAFWLVAYPSQGDKMLFNAHTRSFAALGGVARRGIYDNMKTAVDKVRKDKGRIVNARFAVVRAHCLFDPDFCNVASGWETGVAPKNVQDSRRRIWIDAAKLQFGSFVELKAWLATRCRTLWEKIRHSEHKQFSVAEMLAHEQTCTRCPCLQCSMATSRRPRVSSTCLVSVAKNRYSVPCEWAGQLVSTRLYPGRVVVIADDDVVASHERLCNKSQTRYDWRHYIPLVQRKLGASRNGAPFADLLDVLQRLRRALPGDPGGDSLMAHVLAFVPTVALETARVAGRISVEHVINVLGRLNAAPVAQNAATTLQVATPPLANTARDESLRIAHATRNDAMEAGHE